MCFDKNTCNQFCSCTIQIESSNDLRSNELLQYYGLICGHCILRFDDLPVYPKKSLVLSAVLYALACLSGHCCSCCKYIESSVHD